MGMRTLPLQDEAAFAIAAQLPQGRVFASGRAFVPFVAKGVYARLNALAGPGEATAPAEGAKAAGEPAKGPDEPSATEDQPVTKPVATPATGPASRSAAWC